MKHRTIIFYVTLPYFLTLGVAAALLHASLSLLVMGCELIFDGLRKWEEWACDWKNRYPDMDYKGGGVWVSKKD